MKHLLRLSVLLFCFVGCTDESVNENYWASNGQDNTGDNGNIGNTGNTGTPGTSGTGTDNSGNTGTPGTSGTGTDNSGNTGNTENGDNAGNTSTDPELPYYPIYDDKYYDDEKAPVIEKGEECPKLDEEGTPGNLNFAVCENYVNYTDYERCSYCHTGEPYPGVGQAYYSDGRMRMPFEYFVAHIPGGEYRRDDSVHQIKPFMMMVMEVTRYQYPTCVEYGGCSLGYSKLFDGNMELRDECVMPIASLKYHSYISGRPINCIKIEGAREFCKWVGGRLPTEVEWEYAALHDGTSVRSVIYPWGNEAPQMCVNANYTDLDGPNMCLFGEVVPKGANIQYSRSLTTSYFASGITPLGLNNMSGNVAEFVDDYLVSEDDNYGYNIWIVKGGSSKSGVDKMKIKSREYYDESEGRGYGDIPKSDFLGLQNIGFRCVFDYPEE